MCVSLDAPVQSSTSSPTDITYVLSPSSIAATQAMLACVSLGLKPVSVISADENTRLQAFLSDVGASSAWIGLSHTAGTWAWMDSASSQFTHWADPALPSQSSSNGVLLSATDGKWTIAPNSSVLLPVVCAMRVCDSSDFYQTLNQAGQYTCKPFTQCDVASQYVRPGSRTLFSDGVCIRKYGAQ